MPHLRHHKVAGTAISVGADLHRQLVVAISVATTSRMPGRGLDEGDDTVVFCAFDTVRGGMAVNVVEC